MNRNMRVIVASALCLCAASQGKADEPTLDALNLVCSGQADIMEYTGSEQIRSQEADVRLYLAGDGGTAELPHFIGGAKEGRLVVKIFTVSGTMITGKVNYRPIGNAKMRIDRIAGTVAITGPKGNFSGRCKAFNPAETTPKF